jgi:hypothetical protein
MRDPDAIEAAREVTLTIRPLIDGARHQFKLTASQAVWKHAAGLNHWTYRSHYRADRMRMCRRTIGR